MNFFSGKSSSSNLRPGVKVNKNIPVSDQKNSTDSDSAPSTPRSKRRRNPEKSDQSPPSPASKKAANMSKEQCEALTNFDPFWDKLDARLEAKLEEKLNKGPVKVALKQVEKLVHEKNFILYNMPEKEKESINDQVSAVTTLFTKMGVADALIDDVYRIGKPIPGVKKSRPLMVKLVRMLDKRRIQEGRSKLGKADPIVVDDKPAWMREREKKLIAHFAELKKKDKDLQKRFRRGQLQVTKNKKTVCTLDVDGDGQVFEASTTMEMA